MPQVQNFIKMALTNKLITIHGGGLQSRDLTYVSDAVDAFLKVGLSGKTNQKVVNFGTGKHQTVIFLAKQIKKLCRSKSKIVYIPARKAEVQRLTCDAKLCKRLTGWSPKIGIIDGLKKNIEWAKKN